MSKERRKKTTTKGKRTTTWRCEGKNTSDAQKRERMCSLQGEVRLSDRLSLVQVPRFHQLMTWSRSEISERG